MTENRRYNSPRGIAELASSLTSPIYKKRGTVEAKLMAEWSKVVGEELRQHTQPSKIVFAGDKRADGTLHIYVQHGFATQIQHMESQIIEKIATFLGYRAVGKLKIIQRELSQEETSPVLEKKPTRGGKKLPKALDDIDDDDLKAALSRLGKHIS